VLKQQSKPVTFISDKFPVAFLCIPECGCCGSTLNLVVPGNVLMLALLFMNCKISGGTE